MGLLDRGKNLLLAGGGRPPFERLYVYALAAMVGYMVADLAILEVRPMMLPTKAPPARPARQSRAPIPSPSDYAGITDRNIFNSDGRIPPSLASEEQQESVDGPAVLSQLPLSLQGTIVHLNPQKSVATINLKNRNETQPFAVGEEIEGLARITKVERRKVTFRNLNNNRLEYIEIPKDTAINFGMRSTPQASAGPIEARGNNDFTVSQATIEEYTKDLSQVLNQARMVPNIVPGSGGRVEGFRFVSIQPGSIYEKLGFKPMDVIKTVNGESVNSPTKAMELYNALKSDARITLDIERNGRQETFNYTITK